MIHMDKKFFPMILPDTPDFKYRFFCKLFDDMIVKNVCLLRRGELNDRQRFSCTGCSKDRVLTAMSKRRALLHTRN
jgi:transposase-like protein